MEKNQAGKKFWKDCGLYKTELLVNVLYSVEDPELDPDRRIRMFLGLPDPLVRGTNLDPSLFS